MRGTKQPRFNVAAVIVAAGAGKRLMAAARGGRTIAPRLMARVRKPFVLLAGRPLLAWTLQAFEKTKAVDRVILVVHPRDTETARRLIRRWRFKKAIQIIPGGATRTESVFKGLQVLPKEARWILVHDGARPLVRPELIEATLQTAQKSGAAIAAIPVVPTIKQAQGEWVKATLNRNHLWAVQTPQVFRRDWIEEAHRQARRKGLAAPDDSALVEKLGHRVRLVLGSDRNLKVTTQEDLVIAEALLKDAHRNRV